MVVDRSNIGSGFFADLPYCGCAIAVLGENLTGSSKNAFRPGNQICSFRMVFEHTFQAIVLEFINILMVLFACT